MFLVSITRLRLRSIRFLPALQWHTWKSARQVRRASGFLGGQILIDRGWTAWTMTVWGNEDLMRSFRQSGAHQKVMPKLAEWCCEASSVHWEQEKSKIPNWSEAHRRMIFQGHAVPVKKRSASFDVRAIPAPRIGKIFVQILRPVNKDDKNLAQCGMLNR